jgi:hypothetical protein
MSDGAEVRGGLLAGWGSIRRRRRAGGAANGRGGGISPLVDVSHRLQRHAGRFRHTRFDRPRPGGPDGSSAPVTHDDLRVVPVRGHGDRGLEAGGHAELAQGVPVVGPGADQPATGVAG